MVKCISVLLPMFLFSVLIKAQTFEGLIQYQSRQQGHIMTSEYFIKNSKSKIQLYLDDIAFSGYSLNLGSDLYNISELNKLIKKSKNKIVKGNIKLMKNKKKELILGYTCTLYEEERDTPYGNIIYYISDSLKANNQNGSKRVRNGRIVLKSVQSTYEVEAIEIKKMKLEDKLFELPDYPIEEVDFEKLTKQYVR
ncbi:MAG: hypothetical protein JXR51_16125 [Bacteroidales bacterium]|nr:hypothetical protein [Bacteroidales bacterium]MBN2758695.1 hypothetical protein [Bacteroidales bacterium]